jgi:hypothetical protein
MRVALTRRVAIASSLVVVAIVISASLLSMILTIQGEETLSLKQIVDGPEKYMGERYVRFTITKVTLREDPYHRLNQTYYLVHIKDSYEHEASFVIPSDQRSKYSAHIGEKARFKIVGSFGPGITVPPDRLITNILVNKSTDPYAREFYTIMIYLADT